MNPYKDLPAVQQSNYLTEEILGFLLQDLFPEDTFIRDKIVKGSGSRCRPDYHSPVSKRIFEFDGFYHFTDPSVIWSDSIKTEMYEEMGYEVVHIPYFVQITPQTIYYYFGVDSCMDSGYPHGFIDEKAKTPAYFCSLGLLTYGNILNNLPENIKEDICRSLLWPEDVPAVLKYETVTCQKCLQNNEIHGQQNGTDVCPECESEYIQNAMH